MDTQNRTNLNTGEVPKVRCAQCNRMFRTNMALEMHSTSKGHTSDPISSSLQPSTVSEFTRQTARSNAPIAESQSRILSFNCSPCNRNFKSQVALRAHLDNSSIHQSMAHLVIPSTIPEAGSGLQAAQKQGSANDDPVHAGPVHDVGPEPFTCGLCFRQFSSQSALQNHQRSPIHRVYILCGLCSRKFKTKSALQAHQNSDFHRVTAPKAAVSTQPKKLDSQKQQGYKPPNNSKTKSNLETTCQSCNRKLASKDALKRHVNMMHPGQSQTGGVGEFKSNILHEERSQGEFCTLETATTGARDPPTAQPRSLASFYNPSTSAFASVEELSIAFSAFTTAPWSTREPIGPTPELKTIPPLFPSVHTNTNPVVRQPSEILNSKTISKVKKTSKQKLSFQHLGNRWSIVQPTQQENVLQALRKNCHNVRDLVENGYCQQPYTMDGILSIQRCVKCDSRFIFTLETSMETDLS